MSVASTNAPQLLGTAESAGSTSGGQRQHTRSSSTGSAGGAKKTAEDILKLYDTPQAAVGACMPPQPQGVGLGGGMMGVPGMMQQQQRQVRPQGQMGSFSHHPMSPMMPVGPAGAAAAPAAAAGVYMGQMQGNSGTSSPLGRLM